MRDLSGAGLVKYSIPLKVSEIEIFAKRKTISAHAKKNPSTRDVRSSDILTAHHSQLKRRIQPSCIVDYIHT